MHRCARVPLLWSPQILYFGHVMTVRLVSCGEAEGSKRHARCLPGSSSVPRHKGARPPPLLDRPRTR
jgi:hypothetical protein